MNTAEPTSRTELVEGLGSAAAARLSTQGVETVFDLLRATAEDLHASVGDLASLAEVCRWRAAAAFLEVAGMTSRWADVLTRAGFGSLEELACSDHERLRAAFASAVAEGAVREAPDAETLSELRIDAVRLQHTGAVNVSVTDEDGAPIKGAALEIGALRATTDARGRARFARIPMGQRARLVARAESRDPEVVELPSLLIDEFAIGTVSVVLFANEADGLETLHLSELEGDMLPRLSTHALVADARDAARLSDGDVLLVRRASADGARVQLTSKFLEFRAGTFLAISYHVPATELPAGVQTGDHVQRKRGELHRMRLTPARLASLKAHRRARRATLGAPPAQTVAEREVRLLAYEQAYRLELARGSMNREL